MILIPLGYTGSGKDECVEHMITNHNAIVQDVASLSKGMYNENDIFVIRNVRSFCEIATVKRFFPTALVYTIKIYNPNLQIRNGYTDEKELEHTRMFYDFVLEYRDETVETFELISKLIEICSSKPIIHYPIVL